MLKKIAILFGVVFFVFIGSILPRMNVGVFASPDETAVALFADAWTAGHGFQLPARRDVFTLSLPGLHPRSMIQQGDVLVPVGFLGMPFLVMLANHIARYAGEYVTLLLVLSSAIPLFYLTRRSMGAFVSWSSVLMYLSFPTVLLYVNRGLFPNLPVVAFALWGIWLSRISVDFIEKGKKREWMMLGCFAGLSYGLALFIRPIEGLWLIPWAVWSFWPMWKSPVENKQKWVYATMVSVCVLFIGVLGTWLSMRTYPFHASLTQQPISGYQLKDVIPDQTQIISTEHSTRSIRSLVPFSIHPRTLWNNIRSFFFNHQGIWFGAAVLGAVSLWFSKKRAIIPVMALCVWTLMVLFGMYGQVSYADNINGIATLGNSFLRYMLPVVPLFAIGSACSADALRRISKRGALLGFSLVIFLSSYGVAYALSGDNESILMTRRELMRYRQIYAMTTVAVPSDAVIISERSDKIFASGSWIVASPIPDEQTLTILRDVQEPVYLFHRLIETNTDAPKQISTVFPVIGDPVVILDNEALYPLYGLPE